MTCLIRCSVLVATLAGAAWTVAQTPAPPPAASAPAFPEQTWRLRNKNMVQRWEPLFGDIYSLSAEQRVQFSKLIADLAEADFKYNKEIEPTRAAVRAEMNKYAKEMNDAQAAGTDPAERNRVAKLYQQAQQKYQDLTSSAPLSQDKIAEAIERTLPPEQAARGHKAFLERRPYGLRQPPSAAAMNPQLQTPAAPARPMDPHAGNPTRFRAPLLTAPPVERWPAIVDRLVAERKYVPDQVVRVKAVLKDMLTQAIWAMEQPGTDPAAAAKIADALERDKKLAQLLEPVDRAYDGLIQRIDHIARADQVDAAAMASSQPAAGGMTMRGAASATWSAHCVPAAAPPVERWPTAIDRFAMQRGYDPANIEKARKLVPDAMKAGEAFMQSHTAKLKQAGTEQDKAYAPLDKMYQDLVAAVEKIAPSATTNAGKPPVVSPGGVSGGH